MYLTWEADPTRPLCDREMIAYLYEVSERTVRRHCTPVTYEQRDGRHQASEGRAGLALYDAYAAAEQLEGIAPRPGRTQAILHDLHKANRGGPMSPGRGSRLSA